ncbi:AraC family transcriptional regulator [Paenibacillus psychroresistens]|nr:AraC family transcriptional regulator [Paenibacillus psychroresistens]
MQDIIREEHSYDPIFPLVWIYRMKGDPAHKVNFYHFHAWYEIVFVHEGNGTFFIDKEWYSMKKGDVYTIAGDVIHKPLPSEPDPYDCSVIIFHPSLIHSHSLGEVFTLLQPFERKSDTTGYRHTLSINELNRCEVLLAEINKELLSGQSGGRHAAMILLHQILLEVNRRQNRKDTSPDMDKLTKSEIWLKEILVYIDDNFLNITLNLNILASQALVSPEHFSRVFKQVTGFSLPAYLGAKRIFKAKELLIQTAHTVSYIADICGYNSVSYFHQTFKKQVGCTPESFRHKYGVEF